MTIKKKKNSKDAVIKIPSKQWPWLLAFNYFNIFDALITIVVIHTLEGKEINPIMDAILSYDALFFLMFKFVAGLLITNYIIRKKRWIVAKIYAIIFMLVVAWNIFAAGLAYFGAY